jgi:polysaccharide export outer membrane protein
MSHFLHRIAFVITIIGMMVTGCVPQKEVVYFQGNIPALAQADTFQLRIFKGDILSINVFTTHTDAYPYLAAPADRPASDTRSVYERGYVVRDSGIVTLPLVGNVNVDGLTLKEASQLIEDRFKEYINDPIITLKKLNFKVTVLGEVNKPGLYTIMNERATLPEVLGMAGDLTQLADRTNLRLIRSENGVSNDFTIDLTQSSSLTTSVYFLHPDDIIYVSPTRKRALQNTSPSIIVFTSILTTAAVLITAFVAVTR